MNHKIEIAFLIIGFIATIVALLIYFNKLSDKGFYVKLYGFIISSIAIGLTVFYSEKKSSDTSNEIKTNTFKNLQLTSKVDTTTLETKDEVTSLKEQNRQLTIINEQQSIVLESQGLILNEQLLLTNKQFDHIKTSELKTHYANFTEYQLLAQKFQHVSHYLYKSSCPKEVFLSLSTGQIDKIDEELKNAIESILLNKFVSTDNNLFGLWRDLQGEISHRLYALRLMEGEFIKENNGLYKVDKKFRDERYESLQEILSQNHDNIWKRVKENLIQKTK